MSTFHFRGHRFWHESKCTRAAAAAIVLLALSATAKAQRVELLWPDGAPGAVGTEDRDRPSIGIYLPAAERSSGAAVVICPGGGYGNLSMDKEVIQIAAWLNVRGIAGFVLKYRLGPRYHHPAPLDDAHQALRYVRAHAAEFHIQPDRVGIWGFSAGVYLALRKAGVPAELHIYERGPHGVGLASADPVLASWPARLEDWLKLRGLTK